MSMWRNFSSIKVPPTPPSVVRPRFSLTSDILSFRRCSRQYGYCFAGRFSPPTWSAARASTAAVGGAYLNCNTQMSREARAADSQFATRNTTSRRQSRSKQRRPN
jgi:hypothetical protein